MARIPVLIKLQIMGEATIKKKKIDLVSTLQNKMQSIITPKQGSPLGGCEAKRHSQAESGKRRFLTTSKENTGDLSGGSISPDSKNGGILELRVHAYS